MALKLVQYRVKPDKIEENQRLIEAVFRELAARAPADAKYAVFRLGDGTFCHLVDDGSKALQKLEVFSAFQYDGEARRLSAPQQTEVDVVGNYRIFAD
jgi:hypothetical protein